LSTRWNQTTVLQGAAKFQAVEFFNLNHTTTGHPIIANFCSKNHFLTS
jgi:hypothetical protein